MARGSSKHRPLWRRLGAAAAMLLFLTCHPKEARLSGPVSLEHRTPHFQLGLVSGPSVMFAGTDDERSYHQGERERLRPALEQTGAELERMLARLDEGTRALVLPSAAAGGEVEWSALLGESERGLIRYDHSPYARRLLQRASAREAAASDPTWDAVMAKEFILVFAYPAAMGSLTVRARIAAHPERARLSELERAVRAVARPVGTSLRIARGGARTPASGAPAIETEEAGLFSVRTNHVIVRLAPPGAAALAWRPKARALAARLEKEIGAAADPDSAEFDRTFEFALRKGGYRLAETPLGGGFTSPWLAEVPPEVELRVRLRTVETDEGGPLDRALLERMYELAREQLHGLKRRDSPEATSEIGPADWVLAQTRG